MMAEIYWIKGLSVGRLAILPRPRADDWLDEEINSLRDSGVQVLASLLTRDEVIELGLEREAEKCLSSGIEFESFSIEDRCTPARDSRTIRFLEALYQRVCSGEAVALHCRIGLGRSALVVAAILKKLGYTTEEAFFKISEARGHQVPDTDEQRE
jgi:protein-tyrosine phosphatase